MKITIVESQIGDGLLYYAKGKPGEKLTKKIIKTLKNLKEEK